MHVDVWNKKNACCGCTACSNVCPKHCIEMVEDNEGFVYPKVDEQKCIDCGRCLKTCPLAQTEYHIPANHFDEPLTFAAKHKSVDVRKKSTSGGIFTAVSDFVLEHGGVVCGAAFNAINQRVEHIICETKEERDRLRGSKYVQSYMGDTFARIKSILTANTVVLFTGTPCQCAGLVAYLKKDYPNLYVVDILCHSVPSPLILRDVLKKYGENASKIAFRNKALGWRNSYEFSLHYDDKKYIDTGYLTLFFKGLTCRPSCHDCHFTNMRRPSDITIGDYWNIKQVDATFEDALGVSSTFVNTEKGRSLFEQIKDAVEAKQTEPQYAMQACTMRKNPMPRMRSTFWKDYHDKGFDYVYNKHGHYTAWETFRDRTLAPLARKMKIAQLVRKIVRR